MGDLSMAEIEQMGRHHRCADYIVDPDRWDGRIRTPVAHDHGGQTRTHQLSQCIDRLAARAMAPGGNDHTRRAAIPQLIERLQLRLQTVGVDNIQLIPMYGNIRMHACSDIGEKRVRDIADEQREHHGALATEILGSRVGHVPKLRGSGFDRRTRGLANTNSTLALVQHDRYSCGRHARSTRNIHNRCPLSFSWHRSTH